MTAIFAIDPGPVNCGIVVARDGKIIEKFVMPGHRAAMFVYGGIVDGKNCVVVIEDVTPRRFAHWSYWSTTLKIAKVIGMIAMAAELRGATVVLQNPSVVQKLKKGGRKSDEHIRDAKAHLDYYLSH